MRREKKTPTSKSFNPVGAQKEDRDVLILVQQAQIRESGMEFFLHFGFLLRYNLER